MKSRVDGLSTGSSISLFITFPTVPGNLLRITTHFRIAQTRYCVDISVYHRYIGDGSVYRRSFKDKFVTIRAIGDQIIRNRGSSRRPTCPITPNTSNFTPIPDNAPTTTFSSYLSAPEMPFPRLCVDNDPTSPITPHAGRFIRVHMARL